MKAFEIKPLVSVSLSEQAITEVNQAINDLTDEPVKNLSDKAIMAKLTLQRHLFELVQKYAPEDEND